MLDILEETYFRPILTKTFRRKKKVGFNNGKMLINLTKVVVKFSSGSTDVDLFLKPCFYRLVSVRCGCLEAYLFGGDVSSK